MNRRASAFLIVLLCGTAYLQSQNQPPMGRYYTPDTLLNQLQNSATEKAAQLYLMGAYDLTQDTGQSCAVRGTTTPAQLEQIFSQYLQAHPELVHADRTAAGVAAQAFSEHWPCQNQQSQATEPETAPASVSSGTVDITVQVQGAFGMSSGFGLRYRTNVAMPQEFNDNGGHWSLTCERLLSQGTYTGTYDPQKNKIKLLGNDMKGKQQTTKCEVFSHDWRKPSR